MGIFIILVIAFIVLVLVLQYLSHKSKSYYESKGITYQGSGTLRLLLNILKGVTVIEDMEFQYRKLKSQNTKLAIAHNFGMTTLVVSDPDILRSIFVKDFDHFGNRSAFKIPKSDVLFGKMLFVLQGEKWKILRSKLSPTFTTGKIKRLFPVFNASGKKLVKYLEAEIAQNPSEGETDLNEGYSKFTMDVIASAVIGIDSEAFDQKEPSLFERMGMKLQLTFGVAVILKLVVMMSLPKVADWLGLSFFEKEVKVTGFCAYYQKHSVLSLLQFLHHFCRFKIFFPLP